MKVPCIAWWAVLVGALVLPACSRNEPTAPGLHSITGHVRLTGYLVDADGRFAGTRVVGDADGVGVELTYGDQVVARTTTVDGVYTFTGVGPGAYVARSRVIGNIRDETRPLTISSYDLAAGDTLQLTSRGDLRPVPNPFVQSTRVFFELPDTLWVDVRILDMAGNTVRSLLANEELPGLRSVTWHGVDQAGRPATAALYWVTFLAGGDLRAQLLFR